MQRIDITIIGTTERYTKGIDFRPIIESVRAWPHPLVTAAYTNINLINT